jgi:3-phytase/alkaline phosphatase D
VRRTLLIGLILALTALFWPWPVGATGGPGQARGPGQAGPLRLIGQHSFESRRTFQDTTVGGLSGIAYDEKRGVYYVVADDRGELQAPRFYTLQIDLGPEGITDVRVVGVTTLDSDRDTPGIQPYERGESDFEEIVLLADDTLLISSERDRQNVPWLARFALDGSLLGRLPIPHRYLSVFETGPDGRARAVYGIRDNSGFEGMTVTPSNDGLFLINEDALAQDGPEASQTAGANVRILRTDLAGDGPRPVGEVVYTTDRIFATPDPPAGSANNGVSAMLWIGHVLPGYDLLVLERAFVVGSGNDVNIYGVTLAGATDVRDVDALPQPFTGQTARKTLLANVRAQGVMPDNLEGMALGPRLPNGHPTLLVISDDNFSAAGSPQVNQFLLFEIDPAAR